MAITKINLPSRGNYINGKFVRPSDTSGMAINGEWVSRSPADFSDEIGRFAYSYAAADETVRAARAAFPQWRRTPSAERAEILKRYQAEIKKREDDLIQIISREVGKPLWESKTEVAAMINKVDVTINESAKLIADFEIPKIMDSTTGVVRHRPLGVLAVIGPFNFPGHLPNGHIVPALLTGNCVVFKPSEKTPMVGQIMTECLEAAGVPAGVFNLLQGNGEVGRRLSVHEEVDGILFTGSYEVGTRIKQDTLQQHWKLLALEMGGKNPSIVWDDADLEQAVHETLFSAYVTAGQRCSATSRIIVHPAVIDAFTELFHAKAKNFSIGHPFDNPFMGPLVEQGAVDRYMKFVGIASREGCEIIMRGKALELPTRGNYVTPTICRVKESSVEATKKSIFQQTEFFAPAVAILAAKEAEEAIAQANATQYGLVASIFTKNRALYEKFVDGLNMGLVNWNKSTVGASSRLPFGGFKKSGNHFPTALTSTLYCTAPVASLEVAEPKPVAKDAYPGLNW
ncbi:MAG: aldehyde dehydrogenase family protein [Oligoflexia bacterium]|nr:aldehyde dehydrogenase family protein [Oligoflexia bacterium]